MKIHKSKGQILFVVRGRYAILAWASTPYDRLVLRWSGWRKSL